MKIFGSTVGTTLPKPSWAQANPKKGDYIKDKPTEMEPVRGYSAYQVAVMNGFEGTEKEWLESLKADTEVLVQEIIKEENMETIVQEIIKPGNVETIVQEITKPEHTQTIVQEILKPENTQVIVEQVLDSIPVQMWVDIDLNTMTASHTSAQIIERLDADGIVAARMMHGAYFVLYAVVGTTVLFSGLQEVEGGPEMVTFAVWADGSVTREVFSLGGTGTAKTFKDIEITENADGSVTMVNTFTDGSSETIVLAAGEKPASATYNGVEIPIKWVVGA